MKLEILNLEIRNKIMAYTKVRPSENLQNQVPSYSNTHEIYQHTDLITLNDDLLSVEAYRIKAGAIAWVSGYFTENEIIEALTEKFFSNEEGGRNDGIFDTDNGFCYDLGLDACDFMGEFDLPEKLTERGILDDCKLSEYDTTKVSDVENTPSEEPEYVQLQLELGI